MARGSLGCSPGRAVQRACSLESLQKHVQGAVPLPPYHRSEPQLTTAHARCRYLAKAGNFSTIDNGTLEFLSKTFNCMPMLLVPGDCRRFHATQLAPRSRPLSQLSLELQSSITCRSGLQLPTGH